MLATTVKGERGDYAATPPLRMEVVFPGVECATTDFATDGRTCTVKSKGKTITCK